MTKKITIDLTKIEFQLLQNALFEYSQINLDGAWKFKKGGVEYIDKKSAGYREGKDLLKLLYKIQESNK